MAYAQISTWRVSNARRAQGLGDTAIGTLSTPPRDLSNLIPIYTVGPTIPAPSSSGITGAITSITNALGPVLGPFAAPVPPKTNVSAPVSTTGFTTGEYIGIGVGLLVLLLLIGKRGR